MDINPEVTRMKQILTFLGYYPKKQSCTIQIYVFYLAEVFLIANTIFYVMYNWNDVTTRLKGIRSIADYTLIGFYSLVFEFKWSDMILSWRAIDSYPHEYPYSVTNARQRLLDSTYVEMSYLSRIWYNAIVVCVIAGINIPLLSLAKAVLTENLTEIQIKEIVLLFPFYYPENHTNLSTFILAYLAQNIFLIAAGQYGYLSIAGSFMSMQTVEGELKLLRLSIEHIERTSSGQLDLHKHPMGATDSVAMKSFISYFVEHHQALYRKADDVNRGIQWFAFIANFGVSLYVCLEMSNAFKTKITIVRLQNIFFCLLWVYNIYCYDYFGERIATEDENLRKAVYEYPWVDKAQWFKKTLHVILTRTNRSIQMRPAGLFQLNLKNFALCINAAYSYYNVVSNLSS